MKSKIRVNRRALNDQRLQQAMARRRLIEERRRALLDAIATNRRRAAETHSGIRALPPRRRGSRMLTR